MTDSSTGSSAAQVPEQFRAFVATKSEDGKSVDARATTFHAADLMGDEHSVTVKVEYSTVNYKDGLATQPKGGVARINPLIPGIDLAGTDVATGDAVIVSGYVLGTEHHGGFAEYAKVPAGWVVKTPKGLTAKQAMAIGTAGYTAALSVDQLVARGLRPGDGPVIVTGASGGVGSTAVALLGARGFEVVAATGRLQETEWLKALGASEVIDRNDLAADSGRPLESTKWAGAVDCVGGSILATILRQLRPHAAAAISGLTAGAALNTTVMPFILRGCAILGVNSQDTPLPDRHRVWDDLAATAGFVSHLDAITSVVELDDLPKVITDILAGQVRGRAVVRLTGA